jgi:hypothetical protein
MHVSSRREIMCDGRSNTFGGPLECQLGTPSFGDDRKPVLTIDHDVSVQSTVRPLRGPKNPLGRRRTVAPFFGPLLSGREPANEGSTVRFHGERPIAHDESLRTSPCGRALQHRIDPRVSYRRSELDATLARISQACC